MTAEEMEKVFRRIERIRRKVADHVGDGCEWKYTFPEGDTTAYRFVGVKAPEVVEDEVREWLTWWWNGKDYLKKRAKAVGQSAQIIEDMVNNDRVLAICADLANSQKHGGLDPTHKPRSGENPVLSPVKYSASTANGGIRSITYGPDGIVVPEFDPEKTEIAMEVRNDAGVVMGDALDLLNHALSRWEDVLAQFPQ